MIKQIERIEGKQPIAVSVSIRENWDSLRRVIRAAQAVVEMNEITDHKGGALLTESIKSLQSELDTFLNI